MPSFPRLSQFGAAVLLCLSVLAAGCTVGPDFHAPKPGEMPAAWAGTQIKPATTQPSVTVAKPANLAHWWTAFNDPELNALVEHAIAANLDLQQAASRLRQARAARQIAASALLPEVNANGSYTYSKPGSSSSFTKPTSELYQPGFDATWEIDVFGSTRRNVESSDASIEAAVESQRDTLVTLVAEIAVDYANLRDYQRQIVIAQSNLQAEDHSAELTRRRFKGGLVGKLDVANADALSATTKAQIPVLQTQVQQTIYAISILLNRPPAALLEELSTDAPMRVNPPVVPIGLPMDLLRRRPDIRMAEANLHAANAQIGVATAQLFPTFTLNANVGVQAPSLPALFKAADPAWAIGGFGPGVSWPLFTGGRVQANIKVQDEVTYQALLTYRQTILTALNDVESTLVAYAREQEHRDDLRQAVAANSEAVDLANTLYVNGNTDFLNVITAETALYSTQTALEQSNYNLITDLIALYKALGGGWEDVPLSVGATTQPDLQAMR